MDNIAKESFFQKYKVYIYIFCTTAVLIFFFALYESGYRLTDDYTLGKVGRLEVALPLAGTSVFVDSSQKITTTKDNETVFVFLSPKTHQIIVSKEGYFPWKKDVKVDSKKSVEIKPLVVPSNASGQIITSVDPDYWSIRNKIMIDPLPTLSSPKTSEDGSTKIWVDDNGISAMVGSTTVSVLKTDSAIRNISFYKNRNDAIIFSTVDGIFVIEIDNKGGQNFMPIYKGVRPSFIEADPAFIYVLDGENLMQVIL